MNFFLRDSDPGLLLASRTFGTIDIATSMTIKTGTTSGQSQLERPTYF